MSLTAAITEIPAWFRNTSFGQRQAEEDRQRRHAQRQTLVDRLTTLEAEQAAAREKEDQTLEPLLARVQADKARLDASERKLLTTRKDTNAAIYNIRRRIHLVQSELMGSADGQIDEALRDVTARFDRDRHRIFRAWTAATGQFDDKNLRPILKQMTNENAIQRLHVAMRDARNALENLRLQNPVDLAAAIAAITMPVEQAWADIAVSAQDPEAA